MPHRRGACLFPRVVPLNGWNSALRRQHDFGGIDDAGELALALSTFEIGIWRVPGVCNLVRYADVKTGFDPAAQEAC